MFASEPSTGREGPHILARENAPGKQTLVHACDPAYSSLTLSSWPIGQIRDILTLEGIKLT